MEIYARLKELGISLPEAPKPGGVYLPTVQFSDNLLYTSGNTCKVDGKVLNPGKVGKEVNIETAQQDARQCVINMLSAVQQAIGDLNRVKKVVKLLGFVASSSEFYLQPKVMDGASQLLIDIFGEDIGKSARSAIGVSSLPGNISVEIEALLEISSN